MLTAANEPAHAPVWKGIYEPAEAARYLRATENADVIYPMHSTKLVRWIRRGFADPELTQVAGRDLLMGFDDLISMRVIAALRAAGVSWADIRAEERWLREHTGARHPFATETLWAGRGQVFAEWGDRLVSGSRNGQTALDLLREYLIPIHGLAFDEDTRKAVSWEPYVGIVLQPRVQFGAPCIQGTRIPTRSLAGMVAAGDSIEWVARAYKLSPEAVQGACDWEFRLRSR